MILDENLRITKIESETAKDALKIVYDKVLHDLVDSEKVQKLKEILNLLQKNSRKRNDLGLVFNGYRENPSFLTSDMMLRIKLGRWAIYKIKANYLMNTLKSYLFLSFHLHESL